MGFSVGIFMGDLGLQLTSSCPYSGWRGGVRGGRRARGHAPSKSGVKGLDKAAGPRIGDEFGPHYPPTERLAILELRALRGWSLAQTAKVFHVTPATIASWSSRLDEEGPTALVRTPVPVNKYPDFVRYLVQRLQVLCPRLGKVKIAQVLARAGLHVGVTSVGRMRRESPKPSLTPRTQTMACARRVTAKYPNHLWHADLTTVPTSGGFWTSWLPFALPPCWPFCWWLAVVLDHYSRRVLGFAFFVRQCLAPR